jgi:phage terminase large subunit-like protein
VVAVDPAATSAQSSNETGIIVVARGSDGHGYILADYSLRGTPNEWGGAAVQAYRDWQADHVTPETNNGGEMVTQTLLTVEPNLPIRPVHASRGKVTRAEPIAALYEQGKIHHVGSFPELEDQMSTWVPGMLSPDRMDALVWGATDVMLDGTGDFTDLPADTVAWLEEAFG